MGKVEGEAIGALRVLSREEVLLAERGSFRGGVLHVEEGTRITYEEAAPGPWRAFSGGSSSSRTSPLTPGRTQRTG